MDDTSMCIVAASGLGFSFRVRAWKEMKRWYVEDMYMLTVISNEKY